MSKIQVKRGLSANWQSKNPVLSSGEIGYAIDTNVFKIGDGITPWNNLNYANKSFIDSLELQLDQKANIDGYYAQMTVGNSEQLVSDKLITDTIPFAQRTSGGNLDIGNYAELEKAIGLRVTYKNFENNSNRNTNKEQNGITYTTRAGSYNLYVQGNATADSYWLDPNSSRKTKFYKNHVYLISVGKSFDIETFDWYIPNVDYSSDPIESPSILPSGICLKKFPKDIESYLQLKVKNNANVNETFTLIIADLSLMLSEEVAEHICKMEISEPSSGVKFIKDNFRRILDYPNDNSYSSLQSFFSCGFNHYYNGEAICLTNMEHQITGPYESVTYNNNTVNIDENGHFIIEDNTHNVATIYITGGNNNETCVHPVLDGSRDGEYEVPTRTTIEFPSLVMNGILKVRDNLLYCDGDEYKYDGTFVKNYEYIYSIDLNFGYTWTKVEVPSKKYKLWVYYNENISAEFDICLSNIYLYTTKSIDDDRPDRSINVGNPYFGEHYITIRDDENIDQLSSPPYLTSLVYKKKTPTTESAGDGFSRTYYADPFGIEIFNDIHNTPTYAGHLTKYSRNLKSKLQKLPEMPPDDGQYLVNYSDNQCRFSKFDEVDISLLNQKDDEILVLNCNE